MKSIWGNRGAAAVEFAVLFLLLMIIVFGIIEFGFIWLQSHYIANAAREGARVAARVAEPETTDRPQVENAVQEYLEGLPLYDDEVTNCCGSGDFIEVVIADEVIDAGLPTGENPDAIRVTVTVQTAEVWDPILWDLLTLVPGSSVTGGINGISEFAVFAVE
ncbi:MAG: TadE/TadG family type IV pilus assembly protein [Thermodesulfobacteriota bacterium]